MKLSREASACVQKQISRHCRKKRNKCRIADQRAQAVAIAYSVCRRKGYRIPRAPGLAGLGKIVDYNNNPVSAKAKAQSILMDWVSRARGYWAESDSDMMTEREKEKVHEQMEKQADRIAKLFGYDRSWSS